MDHRCAVVYVQPGQTRPTLWVPSFRHHTNCFAVESKIQIHGLGSRSVQMHLIWAFVFQISYPFRHLESLTVAETAIFLHPMADRWVPVDESADHPRRVQVRIHPPPATTTIRCSDTLDESYLPLLHLTSLASIYHLPPGCAVEAGTLPEVLSRDALLCLSHSCSMKGVRDDRRGRTIFAYVLRLT